MIAVSGSRGVRAALALVVLAGLALLSVLSVQPPAPRGADAPPGDFSAGRAFAHVERVGSAPHVAGSPAAEGVREYITEALLELGLTVETQDTVGRELV